MPTVIDALVATLSLDPSKYLSGSKKARDEQKKLKESAESTGKGLEAGAKKGLEAFVQLRREVLGLLTIFTAGVGLKQFVSETVDSAAATGRLAHNLDISTEALSTWQGVLRRNGGTAEDANATFQMLSDTLQEIKLTGTTSKAGLLTVAGLRASDLKDSQTALLKLSDTFSKMDPQRAAWIGKSLGLPQSTINVLEKGRGAVMAMLAEQQKIGGVTDADTAAAQKLQNTLSSLQQSFTTIGRSILTAVAPALDLVAKVVTFVGETIQRNKPIIIGAFIAMGAELAALAASMLPVAVEMLAVEAPFLAIALAAAAAGAAIGAVVEVIMGIVRWFANLLNSNRETREAMAQLGAAAQDLWAALKDAFAPLKPIFDAILGAVKAIGGAIAEAFGGASLAVAKTFINFLTNQFRGLADIIRAVTALVHGDLRGALASAGDYAKDAFANPVTGGARKAGAANGAGGAPAAANGNAPAAVAAAGSIAGSVVNLLHGLEGFRSKAYWDNHQFSVGFGSSTRTDARTGQVTRATAGTTVSREDAEADVKRRVETEFLPKTAALVGAAWSKLGAGAKTALVSLAYNYGSLKRKDHLLDGVLNAARAGDEKALVAAITARVGDNGGQNRARRLKEAALVGGSALAVNGNIPGAGTAVGARAQYAAVGGGTTNSSSVQIDEIKIYPPNGDADSIARSIGPAIKQRNEIATQANTGLS